MDRVLPCSAEKTSPAPATDARPSPGMNQRDEVPPGTLLQEEVPTNGIMNSKHLHDVHSLLDMLMDNT